MKIRIVKPDARIWGLLAPDTFVEIDLHDFWKQHEVDDKEYFLEKLIKEKLGVKHG